MFEHWDSFFLLIGGAAGALIGLLFIVVTLMRGGDSGTRLRGASVFMTPTVAHLAMVLTVSALATAPGISMAAASGIIGVCALVCLAFSGRSLAMLATGGIKATHWSDLWGYGVAPLAVSLALLASTAAVWFAPDGFAPDWGARWIAISLVAILLLAIRNAWDLVTWITAKGDQLDREDG
jgi:hypothetical protein